jgi:hypothetical protein
VSAHEGSTVKTAKISDIVRTLSGELCIVLSFTPIHRVLVGVDEKSIADGIFVINDTVQLLRRPGTEELELQTVDR